MTAEADARPYSTASLLGLFFVLVWLLHLPLLRLPYFWDEAGYYVPAARDLYFTGSLIPHSTLSNAHPPLVLAYLALAWKVFGYAPAVTRTAMLSIAALALVGLFRLAHRIANIEVAVASTICTTLYPVFFVQSSLAHVDLAAAGFTFWGLLAYVENRPWRTSLYFSLAVLSKETAVLGPLALLIFELAKRGIPAWLRNPDKRILMLPALIAPLIPLAGWYLYHWHRTGFVFGNPEFVRYNVQATLHPLRIFLALGLRLWQVLAYMGIYLLTLATILALTLRPISERGRQRERIAPEVQFCFLAVILAYVVVMAVIGGAVLARYMLPVVPLVIIVFISTLRRRVPYWRGVVAMVVCGFAIALFVNPSYGFSLEDNLAYRDYILLHERAETFLEARYAMAKVLTAWPVNDELSRPYLGYVTRPMQICRIEDFTVEQLSAAAEMGSDFDVALVFSTKYEPAHARLSRWQMWQQWKTEFFGYHRDLQPSAAAEILHGELVYEDRRSGQWVGIIVQPSREKVKGAESNSAPSLGQKSVSGRSTWHYAR